MFGKIFLLFLAWRLFLFIPLLIAHYFLLFRAGYPYTSPVYFLNNINNPVANFLISPFGNFDGVYYLIIATGGYTVDSSGFFPLFPLLINIVTSFFGQNILPFDPRQYFTALTLTSLYFLLSLFVMYKLISLDYKNNIAIGSIIFLLIFPTSFFFAGIYPESLFLLLSLVSFYFARKKKWVQSGITAALLSTTRMVGIAIFPALLYEYFKHEKNKSFIKLMSIFLAPLGLIAYIFYNFQKWGNPFYFIQAQGNLQNNRTVNSIILFPQTLFRYIKILFTVKQDIYEWWVAFFELSFFVFTLSLLYIAWKKKVRFSYLIFGLLCLLMPSLTGTLSGIPRYVLIIFPIFITLALVENRSFKIIYCTISILLLFIFFMLFSQGYFIA